MENLWKFAPFSDKGLKIALFRLIYWVCLGWSWLGESCCESIDYWLQGAFHFHALTALWAQQLQLGLPTLVERKQKRRSLHRVYFLVVFLDSLLTLFNIGCSQSKVGKYVVWRQVSKEELIGQNLDDELNGLSLRLNHQQKLLWFGRPWRVALNWWRTSKRKRKNAYRWLRKCRDT